MTGLFDASGIDDEDAVLNGIAHDPATGRIFVTGKLWPKLFEIRAAVNVRYRYLIRCRTPWAVSAQGVRHRMR